MASESVLMLAFAFVFVGVVVYLANQEDLTGEPLLALRLLLYFMLGVTAMLGLSLLQLMLLGREDGSAVSPYAPAAAFIFIVLVCAVGVQVIWRSPGVLVWVQRFAGRAGTYNPDSSVHNTAVVLALVILAITLGSFVWSGGLSGIAQDLQQNQISPFEPLLTAMLQISIAFLGVGLSLRRTLPTTLARLGLRIPTPHDIAWGIGGGIALFIFTIAFATIWTVLTSPEQLQQQNQASEQLARALNSLPLAFISSISAAFGEEIFIRGAMQPVFGLGLTSLFFTLLHTQYLFTPALIPIMVISLGFGWLRNQYSTSAAIIAHFVYNFVQLTVLVLLPSVGGG